jgi:hypothetical protein
MARGAIQSSPHAAVRASDGRAVPAPDSVRASRPARGDRAGAGRVELFGGLGPLRAVGGGGQCGTWRRRVPGARRSTSGTALSRPRPSPPRHARHCGRCGASPASATEPWRQLDDGLNCPGLGRGIRPGPTGARRRTRRSAGVRCSKFTFRGWRRLRTAPRALITFRGPLPFS